MSDPRSEEKLLLDAERSPIGSPIMEKEGVLPRWSEPEPTPRKTSRRDQIINFQCILLNTSSTIAIVFLNKIAFSDEQLRYCQISIAAWHFLVTAIVMYLATCSPFRAFQRVRLPIAHMLPISSFFCAFLILGNFSLSYNSVGFYQLAKIMTTPTVVLLNFLIFGVTVSHQVVLSVIAVCFGVAVVTTTVVASNPSIKDLEVSPQQLLLNQAPVSVVLLLILMPFSDTMPNFSTIPSNVLWTLVGSGVLASMLNLSQFLIIGRTSTLTVS
ncbi:hypothetical protein H2203_002125 [Taxawa tesnikishii (nom. ined.)]|nr:hypothetical protein H2203_002125 [Dothideales sp. JES 119]